MSNLVYITTSVKGEFKISYGSLGPTEARVLAMIANTIVFFVGNPKIKLLIGEFYLYNLFLIAVICLLFFFYFYTTITQAIELEREDRKKLLKKIQKAEEQKKSY